MITLGWDIGGSNTKVCCLRNQRVEGILSRPFEVRTAPDQLVSVLRTLAVEVAGGEKADVHAVTMTAELSRNFQSKAEGVAFVRAALTEAFPGETIVVFTVDGEFVRNDRMADPLAIASANWMATARMVAAVSTDDLLMIDMGSTTTDIIPIVGGRVVATGRTDPERLASGELVYSGVVRTPVEALAHDVQIHDTTYGLAAEGFATSGDVYVWRGELTEDAYSGETADGQPAMRKHAGIRLRRALCADEATFPEPWVDGLAEALAHAQESRLTAAMARIRQRHPSIRQATIRGLGAFVAARAAKAAGLEVKSSNDGRDDPLSRCVPAFAVALLLDRKLASGWDPFHEPEPTRFVPRIEMVVKVGGGLLAHADALTTVLDLLLERGGRTLVVPGGGPFADAVREVDRHSEIGDDAAHWMAVHAMDQCARLLVDRLGTRGRLVDTPLQVYETRGDLPVIAPLRWLQQADPLPHSWDVTSDSIAAWVAGKVEARRLILIKPPAATGDLVDAYFERALPAGIDVHVVPADQVERLRELLRSTEE